MDVLVLILKIVLILLLTVVVAPWVVVVLLDTVRIALYGLFYARKIAVEIRNCINNRDEIKIFSLRKSKNRIRDDPG